MKIEYKIVDCEFYNTSVSTKLEEQVNTHILEGWKPLGGVTATKSPDEGYYYLAQAMVRTSE